MWQLPKFDSVNYCTNQVCGSILSIYPQVAVSLYFLNESRQKSVSLEPSTGLLMFVVGKL